MSNRDNEFLLWIAKRLVHKYGESKDLLTIVETIVKKNDLILDTLQKNQNSILSDLTSSIDLSMKVLTQSKNNINQLHQDLGKLKINAVTNTFEDLDISKLV